MDRFIGKWILKSSENLEEYLQELGIHVDIQNIENRGTVMVTVSVDGDTTNIHLGGWIKDIEINFKLGEEFDGTTINGRKAKSVVTLEEGKLVWVQKWDGKEKTLVLVVSGNKLTVTVTLNNVVCKHNLERAE